MNHDRLTEERLADYHQDGFIIKQFCGAVETEKLYTAATSDRAMAENALDLNDQRGMKMRLSLWFTPGNDLFGYLTRSESTIKKENDPALKKILAGN